MQEDPKTIQNYENQLRSAKELYKQDVASIQENALQQIKTQEAAFKSQLQESQSRISSLEQKLAKEMDENQQSKLQNISL